MKIIDTKFDFDDILVAPDYQTHISSRSDIILNNLPLMTAPMDTVVGLDNIEIFLDKGIMVVLPRTINYIDYCNYVRNSNQTDKYKNVFVSFGLVDIQNIIDGKINISINENILIDVANAHMKKIVSLCNDLYKKRPDIILMVGNIANPESYGLYSKCKNVKYIRVGIGNGGGCLTTKNTSIGYPMASLIYEMFLVKTRLCENGYDELPKIVADGGMKSYTDIIKALYLGADMVMVGSIFNKALESSGDNYLYGIKISQKLASNLYLKYKLPVKKYFRGMSTKAAQKAMGKTSFKTSEGVIRFRKVEYTLNGWIENFDHYLRSAMSYTDNNNIEDFIGNDNFILISNRAYDRFNK